MVKQPQVAVPRTKSKSIVWGLFLSLFLSLPVAAQLQDQETEYAADKILAKAVSLAEREQYNDAVQELIFVLDYYPTYSRADEILIRLGDYLTEMELYTIAEKIFRHLIRENIESKWIPNALVGLERLFYLQGDYERAISYFRVLRDKFPNAAISEGAFYYAGQSLFFLGDFDDAIAAFSAIENNSEFWGYALYSRALSHFKKKNVDQAISDLNQILKLPRIHKKWALLQERTKLVLGLTYFELGEYEKAIRYLRQVDSDDENHPRALLAQGWCYLKLQQYQKMIEPLETFIENYSNSEFIPEVYLLLGQAHLKIKLYDRSIGYFSRILSMFPEKEQNREILESIGRRLKPIAGEIEKHRVDLLVLESRLLDMMQLPSKKWIPRYMLDEIKKLQKQRSQLLQEIGSEKENLWNLRNTLDALNLMLQVRTKDWRSFAEYGISRALFLKEQGG